MIDKDSAIKKVMSLKIDRNGNILLLNQYAQNRLGISEKNKKNIQDIIFYKNTENPQMFLSHILQIKNKSSIDITFKSIDNDFIYTVCTLDKNTKTGDIDISAIDIKKYNFISKPLNDEKNVDELPLSLLYDAITGSPNKHYFLKYFNNNKNHNFAFIYFDLDEFKSINDSFGRSFGNVVLNEIINRISIIPRDNFTVGRCFSDEFLILIENFKNSQEITTFMTELTDIFNEPFINNGVSFAISYSAGIALYPKDGNTFEDVLNNADIAMHRIKAEGKKNYTFYHPSFKQLVLEKMYMESALREGIKNSEFVLYYQPQVDVKTKKIRGFEALIRWVKPDGRVLPPIKFINNAEETGLMVPIGTWVIEEACNFINLLNQQGFHDVHVAINISVIQITQKDFIAAIRTIIEKTKVNIRQLHIEITETILMKDISSNANKLLELQDMGIIIALDDFGTGYSSLTYLKNFPINILKIEKSFVDDIGSDRKNLVNHIINLGHELDLEVIAEGVEDIIQLNYLIESQCDIIQGYIVSKPLPEKAALQFLKYSS
ncbi:MAG: hypothetical protein ATN31_06430 [Candidatus Epulonipiscioides saccharophilum]|nr:MAG: hypothetical protein ATN31_06430 [Epulopiscium sp. AS2M-Bin001]